MTLRDKHEPCPRRWLAAVLPALLAGGLALTVPVQAAQFAAGDEAEVTGVHDDMVMAAGGKVRINAQVQDDIFAAGGEVMVSQSRADHLITAGGRLTLTGVAARDLIAAGGELFLNGVTVADDLVLSGGRVRIDANSSAGGTAVIAGGDVDLAGAFAGDVTAAGGRVRLDGRVGGNADLSAQRLEIGPGARIEGDLTHRAEEVDIAPDAQITGKVTALDYDERLTRRDLFYRLIGLGVLAALAFLLGGIVLSMVLAGMLPRFMEATNAALHGRTVPALGAGVLWAVGAPLAAVLFMVLVIGIPLGLFLLCVFMLTIPLSGAVTAHFLGRELRRLRSRGAETPGTGGRVGWTLLGAVVLMLLGFIPIIGIAIPILIFLMGAGAAVLVFMEARGAAAAA